MVPVDDSVTRQQQLPILHDNPYSGHPDLSPLQADVLWEYAKTAALVKQLASTTRNLANEPANDLLAKLRTVESQMGLVLTLYKASVWSSIVTAQEEREHEEDAMGQGSGAWDESATIDQHAYAQGGGGGSRSRKSLIPRPSSQTGMANPDPDDSRDEEESYDDDSRDHRHQHQQQQRGARFR